MDETTIAENATSRVYSLAPHVHACRTREHVVLLDLKQDRYLGVDRAQCAALQGTVCGLPNPDEPLTQQQDKKNAARLLIEDLLDQGILVPDKSVPPPHKPSLPGPAEALIDGYELIEVSVTWQDALKFLWATLHTLTQAHCASLEARILNASSRSHTPWTKAQVALARKRVAVFRRLRPLAYTANNECLFHSLALRRFLAMDRLSTSLVFGVATNPFKAHCWLQRGSIVISDQPEYVREYSPILVA
jgi:hypothetical protein